MITAETKVTGPLFEKPDVLAALLRGMYEGVGILGTALRDAYPRGPGRYGHVGDSIRTQVITNGWTVSGRAFPSGRAAFKALFLEKGTHGPHRDGASGILLPRDRRDRAARRRGHAAALRIGPLFRRSAQPHGAPAQHIAERTLASTWPRVQPIFARELGKELGAA